MSIAKTFHLVSSFVQSESCKLTCPDTEDVEYLFSGEERHGHYVIQGEPIRSCGCKAQRVLNRLRPTYSQMRPFIDDCMYWDFDIAAVSLIHKYRGVYHYDVYVVCADCKNRAYNSWEGQGRKVYWKRVHGHEKYSVCLNARMNQPITGFFPGETHPEYFWPQLAHIMRQDGDFTVNSLNIHMEDCHECYRSLQTNISPYGCRECMPHRFEDQQAEDFRQDVDDLLADEILNETLDEEDLRPTTPQPTFEVFVDQDNQHVHVPLDVVNDFANVVEEEIDMSDDEQFDLQQYLFEHGYH